MTKKVALTESLHSDGAPREVNLSEKERDLLSKDINSGNIGRGFATVQGKVFSLLLTNLFPIFETQYEPFKAGPRSRGSGERDRISDTSLSTDNHKRDKASKDKHKDKFHHNKKEKSKTPQRLNIHTATGASNSKARDSRSPMLRQRSFLGRSRETSPKGEEEMHMLDFLNMAPRGNHTEPIISKQKSSPRQHELDLINHNKLLAQFEQQENQPNYAAGASKPSSAIRKRESCRSDNTITSGHTSILLDTGSEGTVGLPYLSTELGAFADMLQTPHDTSQSDRKDGKISALRTYTDPRRRAQTYDDASQNELSGNSGDFGVDAYSNLFREMGQIVDENTVVHSQKIREQEGATKSAEGGDHKTSRKSSLRSSQSSLLKEPNAEMNRAGQRSSYHHSHDLADANVIEDRHLSALEDECFGERSRMRQLSIGTNADSREVSETSGISSRRKSPRKNSLPRTLADTTETAVARRLLLRKGSLKQLAQRFIHRASSVETVTPQGSSPRQVSDSQDKANSAYSSPRRQSSKPSFWSPRSMQNEKSRRTLRDKGRMADTPQNSPFSPLSCPSSAPVLMAPLFSYNAPGDDTDSDGGLRLSPRGHTINPALISPYRIRGSEAREKPPRRSSCDILRPVTFSTDNGDRQSSGDVLQDLLHGEVHNTERRASDFGTTSVGVAAPKAGKPIIAKAKTESLLMGSPHSLMDSVIHSPSSLIRTHSRRRAASQTNPSSPAVTRGLEQQRLHASPQPRRRSHSLSRARTSMSGQSPPRVTSQTSLTQQLQQQQQHQHIKQHQYQQHKQPQIPPQTRNQQLHQHAGGTPARRVATGDFEVNARYSTQGGSMGAIHNSPLGQRRVPATGVEELLSDRLCNPMSAPVGELSVSHHSPLNRLVRVGADGLKPRKNMSATNLIGQPAGASGTITIQRSSSLSSIQTSYGARDAGYRLTSGPKTEHQSESDIPKIRIRHRQSRTSPSDKKRYSGPSKLVTDTFRKDAITETMSDFGSDASCSPKLALGGGMEVIDKGLNTSDNQQGSQYMPDEEAAMVGTLTTHFHSGKGAGNGAEYIQTLSEYVTRSFSENTSTDRPKEIAATAADLSESTDSQLSGSASSLRRKAFRTTSLDDRVKLWPLGRSKSNLGANPEAAEAEDDGVRSTMTNVIDALQDFQIVGVGERSPRLFPRDSVFADDLTVTLAQQGASELPDCVQIDSYVQQGEDGRGNVRRVSLTGDANIHHATTRALSIPYIELTDDEGLVSWGVSTEEFGLSSNPSDKSLHDMPCESEPRASLDETNAKSRFALSQSLSDSFVGRSTRTTDGPYVTREREDECHSLDGDANSLPDIESGLSLNGSGSFSENPMKDSVSPFSTHRFLEKSAQMSGSEKLDLFVRMHPKRQSLEPTSTKPSPNINPRPRRALSGKTISLYYKNKKKLKELDLGKFQGSHSHETRPEARSMTGHQTLATSASESGLHYKPKDKQKSHPGHAKARKSPIFGDRKVNEYKEKSTSPILFRMLSHRSEKKRRKSELVVRDRGAPHVSGEVERSPRKSSHPCTSNDLTRVGRTLLTTDSVDILLGDALTCQLQDDVDK